MSRFEEITVAYRVKGTGKWMFVHIPEGDIDIERNVRIEGGGVDREARITITTQRQWQIHSHYEEEALESDPVIQGQVVPD